MRRPWKIFPMLLCLLLLLLTGIAVPDSGPFITKVDVYRHCLEDDDMLVVVRYNMPYVNVPTETITQSYIGRFMDGSTELARVSPYSYYNKGYGYGGFSMYLDAASAAGHWEGSYSAELQGSPTLEWLSVSAATAMTGAVADDGGSQTDETTASNNTTANDMTLLPATPAVNDAYYYGSTWQFNLLTQNVGTAGAGVWTVLWEYYDGDSWEALVGVTDGTSGFTASAGNHDVTFTLPSDWTATTVKSISAYWIRARVSAYTSVTTQPLGTQSWVNSGATPPSVTTTSLNWRATSGSTATQALMYSHLISYAETLSDHWSIALTSSTAGGTVLSSYGEAYFTNSIPELRTMCPALFSASTTVPQYEDVDWQKSQSEATKATWPFDWGGMSQYLGLPSGDEVFRTLIGFGIIFGVCALLMNRTNRGDFAMLAGYGLLFVFAVPGWISPVIVAGFTFLSILVAGLVFILGKTS